MRVLICPDKFAGTMSAPQAAAAIAEGWARARPADELVRVPLADGGPGFLDVLVDALGGRLVAATVRGPLGEPTPATVLVVDDVAYVESAQACGLHLVPAGSRDPAATSTYGVGQLVDVALDEGARTIVVGLGGSATNDAGAGLLAALGARPGEELAAGGVALAGLDQVDLAQPRARLAGVGLVAATDVDNPLLGLRGASQVFARQKGADDELVTCLDAALARFAAVAEPGVAPESSLAARAGAGAAGGLGYALMLLGGRRQSGIGTVLEVLGLDALIASADLVVTGEGCLDSQSLHGKVVAGVAQRARGLDRSVLVLAGLVQVGGRELSALGVTAAHAVGDTPQARAQSLAHPVQTLSALAERVAGTWHR
ncbi:MAG TPA: glycerate kinase [Actinomycetes bacterium]|nr:glycerate kinase [Actinomycetes bacterium]